VGLEHLVVQRPVLPASSSEASWQIYARVLNKTVSNEHPNLASAERSSVSLYSGISRLLRYDTRQENQWVSGQVLERDLYDVPRTGKPRSSMSDAPLGLQAAPPQPVVQDRKQLATMVVLLVGHTNGMTALQDRTVLWHAVRDAVVATSLVHRRIVQEFTRDKS